MDQACGYFLDPVATMNKGLAAYNAAADAQLHRQTYLTKVPSTPFPAPRVEGLVYRQLDGPLTFMAAPERQRGSCTRPQLDRAPDRIASMYYPVCPTVATAVEPFPRQGVDTRWDAKTSQCCR